MLPLTPSAALTSRQACTAIAIVLGLAYFVLFFRLGSAPIQLWDEARLAVNAAEMLARRQGLVTYFSDYLALWNTKPPLMIWLQALNIKVLGYSPVAVRLPAALAALATVLSQPWLGVPRRAALLPSEAAWAKGCTAPLTVEQGPI